LLDARKSEVGLSLEGGTGSEISDLAIRGASRVNILIKNATDVAVRRVRTTGGLIGLEFEGVTRGRAENIVSDNNRYGIISGGGRANVIVNCTLARNASLGISIPSGSQVSAFNNCVVESTTGVYVGAAVRDLRLDYNVYHALFVGKAEGQVGRKSLGMWRSVSGLDSHSLEMPVAFRDAEAGDFRPSGALEWALDRAATTDWGVAELGGVKAPLQDAENSSRIERWDLGAYEFTPKAPRPADGMFAVPNDGGMVSAGIFAAGGREVAYLFHNLPLPRGVYPFWFPTRDAQGRPIRAGTYELKVTDSALRWEYVHWVGDTGAACPPSRTAANNPFLAVFDDKGHLILGQGWAEEATNLRGYDAATGRWLWSVGGSSDLHGLTFGNDGSVYALKPSETQGLITRVDPQTGKVLPWSTLGSTSALFDGGAAANGLAELEGRLFVTDLQANTVRMGTTGNPRFSTQLNIPAPRSPSADFSTKLLWMLSGRDPVNVIAMTPEGQILANAPAPVPAPAALAARGGWLAIASRQTGRVHLFDALDPKQLRPLRTVGTGDGPFGEYRPDRFHFQAVPTYPGSFVNLALGPQGELAVVEENRLLVFDAQGKLLWSSFGELGNFTSLSYGDPRDLFETSGRKSLRLDEEKGTWTPGTFWDIPIGGDFLGTFAEGGQTFGAFIVTPDGQPDGGALVIVRFEGSSARPVRTLFRDRAGRYLMRRDANHDGRLNNQDGETVMAPPRGPHPLRNGPMFRGVTSFLQPNGDILALNLHPQTWGSLWRRNGLDSDGVPVYRLADCRAFARPPEGVVSPYQHRPDPTRGCNAGAPTDDGLIGLINMTTAPADTSLLNNCGTDLARFDAQGQLRWFHPLGTDSGLYGLASVGRILVTAKSATCEVVALDQDGLGLGSFGFPAEVRYEGYLLDHPQAVRAYQGRDGKTYVLVVDNFNGRQHWWRLQNAGSIVSRTTTVRLSETAAGLLAAQSARPTQGRARPAPSVVRIPRLDRNLPIDGTLPKWREAGITPQIIITPETAYGDIDGPADVSALVRLAYRDQALYVQFLTFDDLPAYFQPVIRRYKQDGVELCINGFSQGFKFDATQTTDAGPILLRSRFFFQKLDLLLPPERCPRIMRVLPNARDVPERSLIESIYGVDLSASPVVITEFKLQIDDSTYRDSTKDVISLKPGQTFRLGILINDNDNPGTDVQNFLVWPATYGNFNPVDDSAIAVLE
jgi:hypothetical protein